MSSSSRLPERLPGAPPSGGSSELEPALRSAAWLGLGEEGSCPCLCREAAAFPRTIRVGGKRQKKAEDPRLPQETRSPRTLAHLYLSACCPLTWDKPTPPAPPGQESKGPGQLSALLGQRVSWGFSEGLRGKHAVGFVHSVVFAAPPVTSEMEDGTARGVTGLAGEVLGDAGGSEGKEIKGMREVRRGGVENRKRYC